MPAPLPAAAGLGPAPPAPPKMRPLVNDKRAAAFRAGSNLTPELAKNRQTVLEEASRPLSGPAAPRLAAPTAVPSNASTSYTGNNVIMLTNGEKEVRVVARNGLGVPKSAGSAAAAAAAGLAAFVNNGSGATVPRGITCHKCAGKLHRQPETSATCGKCGISFHTYDCGHRYLQAGMAHLCEQRGNACPKCEGYCACVGGSILCNAAKAKLSRRRRMAGKKSAGDQLRGTTAEIAMEAAGGIPLHPHTAALAAAAAAAGKPLHFPTVAQPGATSEAAAAVERLGLVKRGMEVALARPLVVPPFTSAPALVVLPQMSATMQPAATNGSTISANAGQVAQPAAATEATLATLPGVTGTQKALSEGMSQAQAVAMAQARAIANASLGLQQEGPPRLRFVQHALPPQYQQKKPGTQQVEAPQQQGQPAQAQVQQQQGQPAKAQVQQQLGQPAQAHVQQQQGQPAQAQAQQQLEQPAQAQVQEQLGQPALGQPAQVQAQQQAGPSAMTAGVRPRVPTTLAVSAPRQGAEAMQTDAPDAPDFNGASVPPSDTVAAAENRVSSLPAGVHDTVVTAAATMAAQQTHLLMAAEQARRKASEANVLAQAKVQAAQTAQKKLLAAQQLALFREAAQAADIKQQLHEAAAAQAAAVASVQAQLAFMPKEDFAAAKISQGRAVQAQVSGSLGIGNGGAADGAALAAMLGVGNGAGVAMPAAGVGAGVSVAAGGNASDSPLLSALMSENKRLTTENAQLTTELALTARVLMDKHSLLEKADDTIRDLRAVMADGAGSG
eukprot:CAMPEP_0119186430 /NCGR_PEP_ID=MMETSP1315-20130426/69013_1 /TAXON_ID=676789 /ORGANISM="Prasinoderma singularis, Strain RCC927" /LENGTH=783 /DNA_ID=CAMNT_0007180867 /DNA_START=466 /DNA_END=2813 /DNA_ORIENTATION=+